MKATIEQNLYKIVAVVGGTCALMAAHADALPVLLQPYQNWIEAVAFVWTLSHAVMVTVTPPQQPPQPPSTTKEP